MYEFVCGGVPFGDSADDPMDVYMAIVNQYNKHIYKFFINLIHL